MKYKWLFFLIVVTILSGCGRDNTAGTGDDASSEQINVVATIGMIADVAQQIGGDYITVTGLMGPGVDPHLYKASAGDVTTLSHADIIFYNGLHLEAKMGDIMGHMRQKTVVAVAEQNIDEADLIIVDPSSGLHDPHVWFDVALWISVAEIIRDTLSSYDPAHADEYARNAQRYLKQLQNLNQYVQDRIAAVPADRRVLITAHDAFNYFGKAYGFKVYGLQGISTQAEAGAADVRELADFIAERKIPAIFVESSIPRRTVEALQAAVRARGYNVAIGGELFSDAMGSPDTPEGTYIGMVRHNVDTICNALSEHHAVEEVK